MSEVKRRLHTLEKKAATAQPVEIYIRWDTLDDGRIEHNGEKLTLEEARAKYPNETFIIIEWDDTAPGQDANSPD